MRSTTITPQKNEWRTPPWVIELAKHLYNIHTFSLDACATAQNRVTERYLSDCLTQPWLADSVWCNPPYSPTATRRRVFLRGVDQIKKGICNNIVFLMGPADPSTSFLETVHKNGHVTFLTPRIKFLYPDGSPSTSPGIGVYLTYVDANTVHSAGANKLEYLNIADLQNGKTTN